MSAFRLAAVATCLRAHSRPRIVATPLCFQRVYHLSVRIRAKLTNPTIWPPALDTRASLRIIALAGVLFVQGCDEDRAPPLAPNDFRSIPHFDELDFSKIVPSMATDYWELRSQHVDIATGGFQFWAIATGGSLEKGQLPDTIQAKIDSTHVSEGFGTACYPYYSCFFYYIVFVHDNGISTAASVDELRQFLGFIDSETEALMLARANDYYWSPESNVGEIRRVNDGFEIIALKALSLCPIDIDRFVLHVISETGQVDVLHSEDWDSEPICVGRYASEIPEVQARSW
jgi:hypothetical protein